MYKNARGIAPIPKTKEITEAERVSFFRNKVKKSINRGYTGLLQIKYGGKIIPLLPKNPTTL